MVFVVEGVVVVVLLVIVIVAGMTEEPDPVYSTSALKYSAHGW